MADDEVVAREWVDDHLGTPQYGVPFTQRQLEVLYAVVMEHGSAQAARRLGISVKTVKEHLTNLYARGGYHNQVQAVWELRHVIEHMQEMERRASGRLR
jgi:DNA-binding CsgD family transcriptional regulator